MAVYRSAVAFLFLTLAGSASAIELGPIEVRSALGQRLRAKVAIGDAAAERFNVGCTRARIESIDGVFLGNPQLSTMESGSSVALLLSSSRTIEEPVVNIIIESRCDGLLTRNYQILLDPPVLAPNLPVTETTVASDAGEVPDKSAPRRNEPRLATEPQRKSISTAANAAIPPAPAAKPRITAAPKPRQIAPAKPRPTMQAKSPKPVLRLSSGDEPSQPLIQQIIDKKAKDETLAAATQAEKEDAELKELNRNLATLEVRLAMLKKQAELAQLATQEKEKQMQEKERQMLEKEKQLYSKEWIIALMAILAVSLGAIIWLGWQYIKLVKRTSSFFIPAGAAAKAPPESSSLNFLNTTTTFDTVNFDNTNFNNTNFDTKSGS